MSEWVEVLDAHNEPEAELAAGWLREAGIEPQLVPSSHSPGAWLTGSRPQWTPVKILVPPDRADEARRLLDEIVGDEASDHEAVAPEPELERASRSGVWGVVLMVFAAIVIVILILGDTGIFL
jgi:hypothetical protein